MKKQVLNLAVLVVIATTLFSGCKKGADDPFFSFRSRTARIVGTWEIVSSETTNETKTTTSQTNNINSDASVTVDITREEVSINGSSKVVTTYNSLSQTGQVNDYDGVEEEFTLEIINELTYTETIDRYNFSLSLEIKDDYTYSATYTETLVSTSISDYDGDVTTITDTVYVYQEPVTRTENGDWNWLDSHKDKIMIQAGPMQGAILRLANEEVILDEEGDSIETVTDYYASALKTFDNILDPNNMEDGIVTVVTTVEEKESKSEEWVGL